MARKLADLKAPIAFVSPRAHKSEDSEVRDHLGARELLRPQDSVSRGKMDRDRRAVSPPQRALKRQDIGGIRDYFGIADSRDAPILAHRRDTGASGKRANRREFQC